LISWKYSFEAVRRELDLVNRKKEALDGLFDSGRISQWTYEFLGKDLTEAVGKTETEQKVFADRMTSRAAELEEQVKSLEMFLANLEIHHAAGEIDDKAYRHQSNAISLGIEATKQEMSDIKGALIQLIPEASAPYPKAPSPPPLVPVETAPEEETPETLTEETGVEESPVEESPD